MRLLAVFLCVCVSLSVFPCGALDVCECGICEVSLFCKEKNDGIVEVVLKACANKGLCGAFGVVSYDGEGLVLLSVGAECGGAVFSFLDVGGEVRFLLDGVENIDGFCVSFFFALAEGFDGEAAVTIDSLETLGYFDGEIVECEEIIVDGELGIGNRTEDVVFPVLLYCGIEAQEGEGVLSVCGIVGKGSAFAGAEVFLVCDGRGGEKMLATVTLPLSQNGEFELSVRLEGTVYAIVITPVAFERDKCVKGEKYVLVV